MSECIEWPYGLSTTGYGKFKMKQRTWKAHRWFFLQHNGYLPPVVRHACDNPKCVNPAHLVGGTQKDNVKDMMERGRHNPSTRITVNTEQLLHLESLGYPQWKIGEILGIAQTTVCKKLKEART